MSCLILNCVYQIPGDNRPKFMSLNAIRVVSLSSSPIWASNSETGVFVGRPTRRILRPDRFWLVGVFAIVSFDDVSVVGISAKSYPAPKDSLSIEEMYFQVHLAFDFDLGFIEIEASCFEFANFSACY